MSETIITPLVLALLFILFASGAPIFLCLGFSGLVGILLIRGPIGLFQVTGSMYAQVDSFVLVAVPLFILMGQAVFITGIGGQIYELASKWLYRLPGGLAVASVVACAIFGAMCGVSIAGVATIGVMAIPEMVRRGYRRDFAVGAVTSAGALAMLIPPSVVFIIYGDVAGVSVGKLFIGGIVPGLVMAMFMSTYVIVRVLKNPSLAPRAVTRISWKEKLIPLKNLWAPLLLIAAVLGTIYTGVATPTESGAMGAVGSLVLAAVAYHTLNLKTLWKVVSETVRVTGAILIIMACAMVFSGYLSLVKIPETVCIAATSLPLPPVGTLAIVMVILIIVGMFVDAASVIIVTTPILLPVVKAIGIDPLFYGILVVITLEMAVITPPVGLNLYTLKSIAPETPMSDIFRGTMPYVGIELACLVLFMFLPQLALWLPGTMMR